MNVIALPGNATDQEIAAVVAALLGSGGDHPGDGYRLWRATRLKALRGKRSTAHGVADVGEVTAEFVQHLAHRR